MYEHGSYIGRAPDDGLHLMFNCRLREEGVDTDFHEGKLICNDVVQISISNMDYTVQGPLGADYYKVREILYKQFAIV
jgi:hypothetical protein